MGRAVALLPARTSSSRATARALAGTFASIVLVLGALMACKGYDELSPGDVCDEAGYSIANRTLACTNDPDLANARYTRLRTEFLCLGGGEVGIGCAQDLFGMSCDQVTTAGDNLATWLQVSPACASLFSNVGADGGLDGGALHDVCSSGTKDCSGTGLCLDLSSTTYACGSCDVNCADGRLGPTQSIHQTPACHGGVCEYECFDGYATCDADPQHVCFYETISDDANCGSCGHVCGEGTHCHFSYCN